MTLPESFPTGQRFPPIRWQQMDGSDGETGDGETDGRCANSDADNESIDENYSRDLTNNSANGL